jgi:hypothetical protein
MKLLCITVILFWSALANSAPVAVSWTQGTARTSDWSQKGEIVYEVADLASAFLGGSFLENSGSYLWCCAAVSDGSGNRLFRSADSGATWTNIYTFTGVGLAWANGDANVMYVGGWRTSVPDMVAYKSTDDGLSWTTPTGSTNGILKEGNYAASGPGSTLVHDERIYWHIGNRDAPFTYPRYAASVMSAAVTSDLIRADSWTTSSEVEWSPTWTNRALPYNGAWEASIVPPPASDTNSSVWLIFRVDEPYEGEVGAIMKLSADCSTLTFTNEWIDLPGGCVKPSIRKIGDTYYGLVNHCQSFNRFYTVEKKRNTLSWISSTDCVTWTIVSNLIFHPDFDHVGYQYPDWIVAPDNTNDVLCVSRTAHT